MLILSIIVQTLVVLSATLEPKQSKSVSLITMVYKVIITFCCNLTIYFIMPLETDILAMVNIYEPSFVCSSAPIWVHHHFCGGFPIGTILRLAQQLGGNPPGCSKVRLWNSSSSGWTSWKHWDLVQDPWYVGSICSDYKCKY